MKGVRKQYEASERTAECVTCWRTWEGPNALAVAARHCAAFGHDVVVEAFMRATYTPSQGTPS